MTVAGWYRIIAAGAKGVAAEYTFNTYNATAECAVVFNSFYSVTGAAGIKTAMRRHQRTDKQAVERNAGDKQPLHRFIPLADGSASQLFFLTAAKADYRFLAFACYQAGQGRAEQAR